MISSSSDGDEDEGDGIGEPKRQQFIDKHVLNDVMISKITYWIHDFLSNDETLK